MVGNEKKGTNTSTNKSRMSQKSQNSNSKTDKDVLVQPKINQFTLIKDPVKILPTVKKIIPNSLKKDHLFQYNVIDKKDFLAYLNKRYKNMSFVGKIMR